MMVSTTSEDMNNVRFESGMGELDRMPQQHGCFRDGPRLVFMLMATKKRWDS